MPEYHPNEHPGLIYAETPKQLGERERLLVDKHVQYIHAFGKKGEHDWEVVASAHFRMSGVYWALMALHLLGAAPEHFMEADALVTWVFQCQHSDGSFGADIGHDGNLLSTLSAVQVLILLGRLGDLDAQQTAAYCKSLQLPDGSFKGDKWGEVDVRFVYSALNCCALLGFLHLLNVPAAINWVLRCNNYDGGFGAAPGCESHSGHVFCCVGALSIAEALDRIDSTSLGRWLSERQTLSGGLQGRPNKLQDVCYSWWALSALSIVRKMHWLDQDALQRFILYCQDENGGGISDRPDDMVDVFHTYFGIAALSLMGYEGLQRIDPTYALPVNILMNLDTKLQSVPNVKPIE